MSGKKGMGHTNYAPEYKAEVLKQIDDGIITLRGFCRDNNINRSIVKRWKREFKYGTPPKRKPHIAITAYLCCSFSIMAYFKLGRAFSLRLLEKTRKNQSAFAVL